MMYEKSLISIVLVNFNSGKYLPRCIESIRKQTWRDYEIIVVDNASSDGSMSLLKAFPEVIIQRNKRNYGYAEGQNQGLSLARGAYILALNYDLVMTPTFLERMVASISAEQDVGWACGKMLNLDANGNFEDTYYAAGHILPPDRYPILRGNGEKDLSQYDKKEYVFGAPGAAALYKRELINDISFEGKFFDSKFFTWFEDIDVDWRAQNRGWKCLYTPDALVYHQGHVNDNYKEPFRSFRAHLTIRNRWLAIYSNETTPKYRDLFRYELSLMIYVIRRGLIKPYFNAVADFYKMRSDMIRKRKFTVSKQTA